MLKVGIIGGGGWLAQTIVKAMLRQGVIGERQLGISYRSKVALPFSPALITSDSQELADASETVMLSVRPADFHALAVNASGKFVISVMAGVSLARITQSTQAVRVIRAMPNVAASAGQSYTPWVASKEATDDNRRVVGEIFGACGVCDEVKTEGELDYLTALSGSGPAFPALLAEALRVDAIAHGLSPETAQRAVIQLLVGTGRLFETDPKPTADIVREFVDYKGVIAAAINAMRDNGFDASVEAGLAAALRKIAALSPNR